MRNNGSLVAKGDGPSGLGQVKLNEVCQTTTRKRPMLSTLYGDTCIESNSKRQHGHSVPTEGGRVMTYCTPPEFGVNKDKTLPQ
ncbi:hypothetical protein D5086_006945 [Populus alba]|uniref:Uncharacterized protein n=1 Tax=Populus alba TaxID=43335 RepID=A0ACC4CM56_POPAL